MGMTLKELLTKGEGTLSAQEAKELASQCRMDVETLYTLLEERGIKVLDNEAEEDASLDVDSIIAEVENAEANSDELGIGDDGEEEQAEENPADLKAAMDELLDDPVKNYLKQIGQSTSRRTAPVSRSKRTRTAGATPRTSTRTAMRSPARTPRRRLRRKRQRKRSRTAP